MSDPSVLIEPLRAVHDQIRDAVVDVTQKKQASELAAIDRDDDGDTIYAIDVVGEERLHHLFGGLSRQHSFVLIAEGIPGGKALFPEGTPEAAAEWRIIVDPIDGTRGLMYQKRSAWILTGVAPNRGSQTSLQDIAVALQTEIPLMKQHLSDQIWAIRGRGASAERYDRLTGARMPLRLKPSASPTIAHGFAMISRFVPGAREELAAIDEEIVRAALGPAQPGKAHCFEDQYISTGGQLYELMAGHDRFVADLRPLLRPLLAERGFPLGLCCHPYDLCAALIASELGVIVTDAFGAPLNAPLDVASDVAWAGYANEQVQLQIQPLLQGALHRRGWRPC